MDTVNAALREIVARRLRLEFLENAASGAFSRLAEPGARENGWH